MKKALLLIILVVAIAGCKSRRLTKESSRTVDKTKTEEDSQVKQETVETKGHTESEEKTFSDQSGTWIWEKWYPGDQDSNNVSDKPGKRIMYERTTYVKADVKKTESRDVNEFENHSELKDSTVRLTTQKDVSIKIEKKDLDAKPGASSWIWPLVLLIIVIIVFTIVFKLRR